MESTTLLKRHNFLLCGRNSIAITIKKFLFISSRNCYDLFIWSSIGIILSDVFYLYSYFKIFWKKYICEYITFTSIISQFYITKSRQIEYIYPFKSRDDFLHILDSSYYKNYIGSSPTIFISFSDI